MALNATIAGGKLDKCISAQHYAIITCHICQVILTLLMVYIIINGYYMEVSINLRYTSPSWKFQQNLLIYLYIFSIFMSHISQYTGY